MTIRRVLSSLLRIPGPPAAALLLLLLLLGGNGGGVVDGVANCTLEASHCEDGIMIPLWRPYEDITTGDKVRRALIYFISIVYMFLGLSIVADRFMASIEVITSKEREIKVKRPDGEIFTVTVRIWNETVSNLTLMALGSSAPEILLSVIEVCGHGFKAGALGPNTIVGSAAFNLFMIIAICVYVIPDNQIRRQKHLSVFFVTASMSVFAYLWLYIILAVSSHGRIEIWEGVVTLLFFPLTVVTAYVADTKIIVNKFLSKRYRSTRKGIIASEGADVELEALNGGKGYHLSIGQGGENVDPAVLAFEEHRREFIDLMKELRHKHPNTDPDSLQQMAEVEMINRGPKSRAFYRVQATRKLTGGGNIVKKKIEKEHHKAMEILHEAENETADEQQTRIFFDPAHYTVLENVGVFNAIVSRKGGARTTADDDDLTIMVDYYTEDGTANAGGDYVEAKGTLTFRPGESHCTIPVEIIDDDVFEEDEHFMIHLRNLRVQTKDGPVVDPSALGRLPPVASLDMPATATVMILDDDHAGVFSFEHSEFEIVESAGRLRLRVQRHSGARGKVLIPFRTLDGTAISETDYEPKAEGELVFDNDETEKFIELGVIDKEEYERSDAFYIELDEPIWAKKLSGENEECESVVSSSGDELEDISTITNNDDKTEGEGAEMKTEEDIIADLGKPRLGDITKVKIIIRESQELKGVVDNMMKKANASLVLGTSSWREQFIEALTVSTGDDDNDGDDDQEEEGDDDDGLEQSPSWSDYLMHFISVPWKILFAFIPPTDYLGGWACFVVSIMGIGLLTAVVGDLASHFGCTIGLKDAVTAITFVALGTSVPDTFASKVAAIQDKYADSSIGNVTGSNAVNVFLGIGIAWTIAAVYHEANDAEFLVEPGTLAFSVTIFCAEAILCILVLLLRRLPVFGGGELGGPSKFKIPTTIALVSLWCFYILMSSLESYCVIKGF